MVAWRIIARFSQASAASSELAFALRRTQRQRMFPVRRRKNEEDVASVSPAVAGRQYGRLRLLRLVAARTCPGSRLPAAM
jgi:hypothetical protein